MTKFAKKAKEDVTETKAAKKTGKGGLVVNLNGDKPSLHVKGQEETNVGRAKRAKEAGAGGKAAKATKTPAKGKGKAEKAERAPREADTRKIKLIEKKNPKREGSSSYDRYELYKTSKTVADFIEAGGSAADVRYDAAKGYIELN